MGRAEIEPTGEFEAGSFQSFTLTYTAGYFGIDDTGSLKIVHRFASDMGRPQFTDPRGWNYTTAEASNGAVLELQYDPKRNIRPWDKTLFIRVVKGFLREGDRIVVRFGDRRQGSPGLRVQTFHEPTFEFRVLVDAIATCNYVELPQQPHVSIVAGPPVLFKAILPTMRRAGQPFRLGFKGEDKWGNPSHKVDATIHRAGGPRPPPQDAGRHQPAALAAVRRIADDGGGRPAGLRDHRVLRALGAGEDAAGDRDPALRRQHQGPCRQRGAREIDGAGLRCRSESVAGGLCPPDPGGYRQMGAHRQGVGRFAGLRRAVYLCIGGIAASKSTTTAR